MTAKIIPLFHHNVESPMPSHEVRIRHTMSIMYNGIGPILKEQARLMARSHDVDNAHDAMCEALGLEK